MPAPNNSARSGYRTSSNFVSATDSNTVLQYGDDFDTMEQGEATGILTTHNRGGRLEAGKTKVDPPPVKPSKFKKKRGWR
jgi:hypothetical protein